MMTLRQALEINYRINILPFFLSKQIRDLQLEVIDAIIKDPSTELFYGKIELFAYEILLCKLHKPSDIYPGDLRVMIIPGRSIRRHNWWPASRSRTSCSKNRRHNAGELKTKVIPLWPSPTK